jgi:hypothetical protein
MVQGYGLRVDLNGSKVTSVLDRRLESEISADGQLRGHRAGRSHRRRVR